MLWQLATIQALPGPAIKLPVGLHIGTVNCTAHATLHQIRRVDRGVSSPPRHSASSFQLLRKEPAARYVPGARLPAHYTMPRRESPKARSLGNRNVAKVYDRPAESVQLSLPEADGVGEAARPAAGSLWRQYPLYASRQHSVRIAHNSLKTLQ
jgi:hypothetical protein